MTKRREGFTLLEIMVVVFIIGVMASVSVPRIARYAEPKAAVLQRAFEEAADMSLSGTPVRLSAGRDNLSGRGAITAEALMKKEEPEDSLSVFLGTNVNKPPVLEWQSIKLKNLPEGEGWKFKPEIIYFYSDGSCSPARIFYTPPDAPPSEAEEYVLTVTGYCVQLEKK